MSAERATGPLMADRGATGWLVRRETGERVALTHDEADAELFAAAPDMLTALEAMVGNYRGPRENLDAARAAIIKARGET